MAHLKFNRQGDSHAGHLISGLTKVTNGNIIKRTGSGCIPLLDVDRTDSRGVVGDCAKQMTKAIKEFAESDNYKTLVISSMGPVYLDGTSFKNKDAARVQGNKVTLMSNVELKNNWEIYEKGLAKTFSYLNKLVNKDVYFLIDIPELGFEKGCNPEVKTIKIAGYTVSDGVVKTTPDDCKITKQDYQLRTLKYKKLITDSASGYPNITIIDPEDLFCDDDWCFGYNQKAGYLYQDADHLSISGSHYFAEAIAKKILADQSLKQL